MEGTSRDIGFVRENQRFRYRACAIIIENGAVLMMGNEQNDYFYSIGGAVQLGETAEEAVLREVLEETGVHFEIDRLVFIHENFFDGDGTDFLKKMTCHELSFYFLMKPQNSEKLHTESFGTDGSKEFTKWIPLSEYSNHKAYPTFFAEELLDLPETIKRIVTHE